MAYVLPTPADLKAYYPAFAAVPDDTIQLYLDEASGASGSGGDVDESWAEGDYKPAIMAAAAHRMIRNGVVVAGGDVAGMVAAGVTDFQSGSFRARFSDEAVKAQVAGGWDASVYGQRYLELLRRNKGGPLVTSGGVVPCGDGFNGFAGPMPPFVGY